MTQTGDASRSDDRFYLNVFCSREQEAFRVHVKPTELPPGLEGCFDRNGEAYPVGLDFEDLERTMNARGVVYTKRVSRLGGVELTAQGRNALLLADWLSSAFTSGVRLPTSSSLSGSRE